MFSSCRISFLSTAVEYDQDTTARKDTISEKGASASFTNEKVRCCK